MKNFISILITNYNKGKFLTKTLKSVSTQKFNNYEIIIYDDCSNDNSIQLIKQFKNVKLIQNLKRKKYTPAQNQIIAIKECFKASKGNILCLLDADDFFLEKKLFYVDNFFKKNPKINCLFNLPKANKNQFFLKNRKNTKSIWPTIIPTSCISLRRVFFIRFMNFVMIKKYRYLEIDARITIFSNFFYNEFSIINRKLTVYNYDENGITSKINKLSKKWWLRRMESFFYLKFILKKRKEKFIISFDYLITKLINSIIS